jgi:hypothetical protein
MVDAVPQPFNFHHTGIERPESAVALAHLRQDFDWVGLVSIVALRRDAKLRRPPP